MTVNEEQSLPLYDVSKWIAEAQAAMVKEAERIAGAHDIGQMRKCRETTPSKEHE